MLKRYIGRESPARIVIAGKDFGTVETGESIPVPDDLANSVAWPEANWADGAPPIEDDPFKNDEGDN
jgi:hypothetical protein